MTAPAREELYALGAQPFDPQTGEVIPEIHISDVGTYKDCRRLHWFSSNMPGCLGLERRSPVLPFFTGRGAHLALEKLYDEGRDPTATFEAWALQEEEGARQAVGEFWPQEKAKLQEQVDLAKGMLFHYEIWQRHDIGPNADRNLQFIATELHKIIPLIHRPDGSVAFNYSFRFDGVVQRTTDNTFWLFETKTARSLDERKKWLANDEQSAMYMWAAEQVLGVRLSGVIYNLMRKKLPTVANPLSRPINLLGAIVSPLSQNKATDTSFEYYKEQLNLQARRACEMYPNVDYDELRKALYEHHKPMLEALWEGGNKFFERYELRRGAADVRNVVANIRAVAEEMMRPDLVRYPNGGKMHCGWCHFRAPCLALNRGADIKNILEEEYQPRRAYKEPVLDL